MHGRWRLGVGLAATAAAGCNAILGLGEPSVIDAGADVVTAGNGDGSETAQGDTTITRPPGLAPCSSQAPFPSTPVLDHFDSPLDSRWLDKAGAFSVQSGQLVGSSSAALYWSVPFGPNQEVYADFIDWDPRLYRLSLVLKKQNPAGMCDDVIPYYSESMGATGRAIQVEYCWGNIPHGKGEIVAIDFPRGKQFGARIFADGRVDLYVDHQCFFGTKFDTEGPEFAPWMIQGGFIGVETVPVKDLPLGKPPVWDEFGGGTISPDL